MGEIQGSVQVSNLKDCLLREVAVRKALTKLVVAQDDQVCSIRRSAAGLKDECSMIRKGLQGIKDLFKESSREAFEAFGGGLLNLVGEFQSASKRHQRESKEDIDSMLDAANRSWQQRNHSLIHDVNREAARIRAALGVMRYARRGEEVLHILQPQMVTSRSTAAAAAAATARTPSPRCDAACPQDPAAQSLTPFFILHYACTGETWYATSTRCTPLFTPLR
jgi:hypothetical protein